MNKITTAPEVRQTLNYDQFSLFDSNRPPSHWPKIHKSLIKKDLSKYNPIMVDSKYRIIDGQGRFFACKELGWPIYYIVAEEATEADISLLNSMQKNWSKMDYLNFHATRGNEDYIRMKEYMEKTDGVTISFLINIFTQQIDGLHYYKVFESGLYKFGDDHIARANVIFSISNKIEELAPDKAKQKRSLLSAISTIIKNGVPPKEFLQKIETHIAHFHPQADATAYLKNFEDIYNRNRRGNKVHFDFI